MTKIFDPKQLKKLYKPNWTSKGEENGQITIIGGSELFHGAPLLALKAASRMVDMIFFATPEKSVGHVAEMMKSKLLSFIWIPWEEAESYIEKSDAVLIGPGFMRFKREHSAENISEAWPTSLVGQSKYDEVGRESREITERFLSKYKSKKWVIDAGSLQTMDAEWIPPDAVITPNRKEFELLIGNSKGLVARSGDSNSQSTDYLLPVISSFAKKHDCIVVLKGPETIVVSPNDYVIVKGGNPGMTKGGTGDILAGLTTAFLAKNDPFLSATCASYLEKAAADELYKKVGQNYSADDLADQIPVTLQKLII